MNKRKRRRQRERLFISVLLTICLFIVLSLIVSMAFYIKIKDDDMNDLRQQLEEAKEYQKSLAERNITLDSLASELKNIEIEIFNKKSELDFLNSEIEQKQKEITDRQADEAYLSKYNYALYDTEGKKNDISLDLLKLGETMMVSNGLDPNLLFGIIMVESEGHANVTNSYSGAAGLGQFMPSTGEYICAKYMNMSYDHSTTPYDPESNIQMIANYLSYLYNKYDGSTMNVLKEYCGGDEEFTRGYYNKICNVVGYCIN